LPDDQGGGGAPGADPGSFAEAHPDSKAAVALKLGGGALALGGIAWAVSKKVALGVLLQGAKGRRRK